MFFPFKEDRIQHMEKKKYLRILPALLMVLALFQPWPVNAYAETPDPSLYEGLGSDYIYICDAESGQVLTERNPDERMYPASMTKILTVIVALDHLTDMDQIIEITDPMVDGLAEANASVAGFTAGDRITVRDALYGAALPSGADASNALAFTVAGSVQNYVDLMNEKAQQIGMSSSHFVNSTGLHDDNHYSTARDIASLLAYCIKNEQFAEIFSAKKYTSSPTLLYPDGIEMRSTTWYSADYFGISLPGLIGSKTGFTYEAGHCLAWWAEINGMKLVGVNAHCDEDDINSHGHLNESSALLNDLHGYEKTAVVTQDDLLDTVVIHYSDHDKTVEIHSDETIIEDMRTGNAPVITSTLTDEVSAGLDDQEITGIIRIEKDGHLMFEKGIRITVPKERNFWARVKMRWNSIFNKNSGN